MQRLTDLGKPEAWNRLTALESSRAAAIACRCRRWPNAGKFLNPGDAREMADELIALGEKHAEANSGDGDAADV